MASHTYCRHCGQKTNVSHLNLKAFLDELAASFLNGPTRQFFTFYHLLLRPGGTIRDYVVGGRRKRYQSPVSYFVFSILLYFLFSIYILPIIIKTKNLRIAKEDISHSTKIGDIYFLFVILMGMAVIGWFFCGLNWGAKNRRSYNLIESIAVFSFIYGSNFLLDIPLVFLEVETPILKSLMSVTQNKSYINLLTDIPMIFIIAYMAFDFCKTAGIGIHRYILTLIFGFGYYILITNLV